MAEQPPGPHRWQKLGARTHSTTRVFEVQSVRYRHPTRQTEREFYVIDAPDWVNVIALTPDHQLVLVRQFRFGIDGFSLEIPGGVMEPGEDPVTAAQRELREETGYTGARARVLGRVHPNPAIQNNRCHLVLVEDARRTTRRSRSARCRSTRFTRGSAVAASCTPWCWTACCCSRPNGSACAVGAFDMACAPT